MSVFRSLALSQRHHTWPFNTSNVQTFLANPLFPPGRSPLCLIGMVTVALQLVCASTAIAEDFCASLNGSNWKDATGHPILVNATMMSFVDFPQYQNMQYTCTNNRIHFWRFPEWTAIIAEDGLTASFRTAEGENVWQLVSWPTDCNLSGQTVSHEHSITAYERPAVSLGQKCVSEIRTCSDGTLSGSFLSPSCVVQDRQMPPSTAATLVASVLLIGWLARRLFGLHS